MKTLLRNLSVVFSLMFCFLTSPSVYSQEINQQDYNALVTIYNNCNGPNWTNTINNDGVWLQGPASGWYGVTITGDRVTDIQLPENNLNGQFPNYLDYGSLNNLISINLSSNNLTGQFPYALGNLPNLQMLDISFNNFNGDIQNPSSGVFPSIVIMNINNNNFWGQLPNAVNNFSNLTELRINNNQFNWIPDFSILAGTLNVLWVNENQLDFGALEPNMFQMNEFIYAPQDSIGQREGYDANYGDEFTIPLNTGGSDNMYQWYLNENLIPGATDKDYHIPFVTGANSGWYFCEITSNIVPDLTLYTRPKYLRVKFTGLEGDQVALEAIYNAMNGPNWTNQNNWMSTTVGIEEWEGVVVEPTSGRVIELNLANNNLAGRFPAELSILSELKVMNMNNNNICCLFETEGLDGLMNLEVMNLSHNDIGGNFPDMREEDVGIFPNLKIMDLSYNQITGTIPENIWVFQALEELRMNDNQMSGIFPTGFGNMQYLKVYDISNNNFFGEIPSPPPSEMKALTEDNLPILPSIEVMNFGGNNFTGPVPEMLNMFVTLRELYFHDNAFTKMPLFESLINLEVLTVENNYLDFSSIEPNMGLASITYTYSPQYPLGHKRLLPAKLGDAISVTLDREQMPNNTFQWFTVEEVGGEPVRTAISGATSETYNIASVAAADFTDYICEISNTQVPGLILSTMPVRLIEYTNEGDLDRMALEALYNNCNGVGWAGVVNWNTPALLDTWTGVTVDPTSGRVTELNLSGVGIQGVLPMEMELLSELIVLNLSTNLISGQLFPGIDNLSNLEVLDLSHNQLNGTIPHQIVTLTNLKNLSFWDNQITGTIPQEIGNLINLEVLSLSSNQLYGELPYGLNNLVNLKELYLSTNQFNGEVHGRLENLVLLEKLWLSRNHFRGGIPNEVNNMLNLNTFSIVTNEFDYFPHLNALTNLVLLDVRYNYLDFCSLEPNIGIAADFRYNPQEQRDDHGKEVYLESGANLMLYANICGTQNTHFQWFHNWNPIMGANGYEFEIVNASFFDQGEYICEATNSMFPNMTIRGDRYYIDVNDDPAPDGWVVNPVDYAFSGQIYAELFMDGHPFYVGNTFKSDGEWPQWGILAAFYDGVCRGVSQNTMINQNGNLVFILDVFSNVENQEELEFKFFFPYYNPYPVYNKSTENLKIDPANMPIFDIQETYLFENNGFILGQEVAVPMHFSTIKIPDNWKVNHDDFPFHNQVFAEVFMNNNPIFQFKNTVEDLPYMVLAAFNESNGMCVGIQDKPEINEGKLIFLMDISSFTESGEGIYFQFFAPNLSPNPYNPIFNIMQHIVFADNTIAPPFGNYQNPFRMDLVFYEPPKTAALQFDGMDDYARLSGFIYPTSELTIEAWVKPYQFDQIREILFGFNPTDASGVQFRLGEDGRLLYGESPTWTYVTSSEPLVQNQWNHIALVRNLDGLCKLYINGFVVAEYTVSQGISPTDIYIGGRAPYMDRFFSGEIDEVRIWTTARNESELQSNMKNYLNGDENGLLAYWRMDENQGQYIDDLSGHGYGLQLGASPDPDMNDPNWLGTNWPYNLPLDAKFSADITSGEAPLTVHFYDNSTGDFMPNNWVWDFNSDGYPDSFDQNPVWTFGEPGTFTVSLQVSDGMGNFNTEFKHGYITVFESFKVEAPRNLSVTGLGFASWELPHEMKYFDDFEAYNVGGYLAAQSDMWHTWGDNPNTDALISDDQALSGTKSVKFEGEGTSDLILDFGNITKGHFQLKLNIYVVPDNGGYFNMLHNSDVNNPEWAMDVLFAADGTGTIHADNNYIPFAYIPGAWTECVTDIDLDNDLAIFYVNGNQIHSWQWSQKTDGTPGMLKMAALDIYSHAPEGTNPLYYIDDLNIEFMYNLTGYNVYLDGNNVGSTTDLFWQYANLEPGVTYKAGVSAVYGEGLFESTITEKIFLSSPVYNVGISTLITPVIPRPTKNFCGLTNNEVISVEIFNNGLNPMSNFDIGYSVDNGIQVIETYSGTLNPGDTIVYTFTTLADFYTNEYYRTFNLNLFIQMENQYPDDDAKMFAINVFGDYTDEQGWTNYNSCDGLISDNSWAIAEDMNGHIWTTGFYGASKFDGSNWSTYNAENGLGDSYNWAMTNDRQGNIWFSGTQNQIITKYDGSTFTHFQTNGMFEECVYADKSGNIWFGSYEGFGILKFDGSNWINYPHHVGIAGQLILSIGEDINGNIYASSYAGLSVFNGNTWSKIYLPNHDGSAVTEIFLASNGITWFTTASGFYTYDGYTWNKIGLDQGAIPLCEDISEGPNGVLWFGGGNDLVSFDGNNWRRYTTADGLIADNWGIFSVLADSQGDVWVGRGQSGLSKFTPQGIGPSVDWYVNPANYAYDGEVNAEIFLDDMPAGPGVLGAFVNGECRGVSDTPLWSPNGKLVYTIRIWSNQVSGEEISFQFFHPARFKELALEPMDLPIFNIQERITFESDMVIGDYLDPFAMHAYTFKEFNRQMTTGWNWFSVYLVNENMSLDNILASLNPQPGDYIKDRKGLGASAEYFDLPEFKGWGGNLFELDPKEGYKMQLHNPGTLIYQGYPIDYENEEILVDAGWNWIGYPIPFEMEVFEYLTTLDAVYGDYIKNQFLSSTYLGIEYGWFGQLSMMRPGDGYLLKVANDGSIHSPDANKYKATTMTKKDGAKIDIPKYNVKAHDFEYSGSAIIEVFVDEINIGTENNILYAFNKEDVCVGIINGMLYPMTDKYLYNLMMYSNIDEGDEIHFKFYEKEENKWYSYEETMNFNADMIVADVFNPFELKNAIADDLITDVSSIELYPNPFTNRLSINFTINKTQNVRVAVYDSYGKMIELLADKTYTPDTYLVEWNATNIPVGIYYVRIEKQENVDNLKVLKVK